MKSTAHTAPKVKQLTLCALFAAVTAVLSQIALPLPFTPVPINLATLAVFVAGGLLGPVYGAVSLLVYTIIGAVGVPVYAQFMGGLSVLLGPTGGYIFGYTAAAFLTGLIAKRFAFRFWGNVIAMTAGLAACYTLGTAWFMMSTQTGLLASIGMCVAPFLLGDALKIACAAFLVHRLAPHVR